jgi:hypothetical protein
LHLTRNTVEGAFIIFCSSHCSSTHHLFFPDLQQFSNAHMPSPPTVLVLPLLIPLSVCHDAAKHLIDALGGPEAARSIVGGTEWWQVRGERGVRGEWIAMRRDWREREKKEESHRKKWKAEREKEKDKDKEERPLTEEELGKEYEKEKMDEMREWRVPSGTSPPWLTMGRTVTIGCMLYIHGVRIQVLPLCSPLS